MVAKPSPEAAAAEPVEFDDASTKRLKARVRAILAERFKLVVRRETREMPAYALKVAKDGPKLTAGVSDATQMVVTAAGLESRGVSMEVLGGELLSRALGRKVVDQTGPTGKYDFLLKFDL